MHKPHVWNNAKYVIGGVLVLALVVGGVYFGNSGTFKGSFIKRGITATANFGVSVNGYPEQPGVNLKNAYANMYTVKPVQKGMYIGELVSTKSTGASGTVTFQVPLGSVVNFVGFKTRAVAESVKQWTFSSPPYKNFSTVDGLKNTLCQTNFLDTNAKMQSNGTDSCAAGWLSKPYSDKEVKVIYNGTKPHGSFEVLVQKDGVNIKNATVKIFDEGSKMLVTEASTGSRGAATFIIQKNIPFYVEAFVDGVMYGGRITPYVTSPRVMYLKSGSGNKDVLYYTYDKTNGTPWVYVYPGGTPTVTVTSLPNEDCFNFDPKKMGFIKEKDGTYTMTVGAISMSGFPTWAEFTKALLIIQNGGFTSQCFVGRGQGASTQKDEPMEYWLNAKHTMATGKLNPKEDCVSFNRANLNIKDGSNGSAYLMEGKSHSMLYASSRAAIQARWDMIKAYGANSMCYVGRPDPSMIYFKK